MNNAEFDTRLNLVCKTLFKSGFLENADNRNNFTGSDLAQIQVGLAQIAVNAVLAMEKTDLEREAMNVSNAKMQSELELTINRAKIENIKIMAEAIAQAIQAESIKRSVTDNATINKTNAYVSFFNVAMNAIANNSASLEDGTMLSSISTLVMNCIETINTEALGSNFDDLLTMLTTNAQKLDNIGDGTRKVQIIAPKNVIMRGEPLTLIGLSTYGNNACEFIDGENSISSRFYTFSEPSECKKEITFRVKNNEDEWVSDTIHIVVTRFKYKKKNKEIVIDAK